MTEPAGREPSIPVGSGLRLMLSWGLVSIPLLWGVYQTFVKSMALFQ